MFHTACQLTIRVGLCCSKVQESQMHLLKLIYFLTLHKKKKLLIEEKQGKS